MVIKRLVGSFIRYRRNISKPSIHQPTNQSINQQAGKRTSRVTNQSANQFLSEVDFCLPDRPLGISTKSQGFKSQTPGHGAGGRLRRKPANRRALTMIELMVAVSILAVGLVFILRSLSSQILVLNHMQNTYFAAKIVSKKLDDLEEELIRNQKLGEKTVSEDVKFGGRVFSLNIEITSQTIDMGEFPQILSEDRVVSVDYPEIEDVFNKVRVRASWKERNAPQELTFTTYLEAELADLKKPVTSE